MEYLKEIIKKDGRIKNESVLDVSSFFNKQVDVKVMQKLGEDFAEYYKDYDYDMFVTVETSGIAPSVFAALYANKPLLIIKKERELKDPEIHVQQEAYSFTKDHEYYLTAQREYIEGKKIILLDDFLARGSVVFNVDELLKKANATLVSTGICISKNFQDGYKKLSVEGYDLYLQAKIKKLNTALNIVEFEE